MTCLLRAMLASLGMSFALASQSPVPKNQPPAKDDAITVPYVLREEDYCTHYSKLRPSTFTEKDERLEAIPTDKTVLGIVLRRDTDDYADVIHVSYAIRQTERVQKKYIALPTLGDEKGNLLETQVYFYVRGKSKKMYEFNIHNTPAFASISPFRHKHTKLDFAKFDEGQNSIHSSLNLQTSDIKRYLIAANREEFAELKSPEFYAKMKYNATDNGSLFKLKAWTGMLESNHSSIVILDW